MIIIPKRQIWTRQPQRPVRLDSPYLRDGAVGACFSGSPSDALGNAIATPAESIAIRPMSPGNSYGYFPTDSYSGTYTATLGRQNIANEYTFACQISGLFYGYGGHTLLSAGVGGVGGIGVGLAPSYASGYGSGYDIPIMYVVHYGVAQYTVGSIGVVPATDVCTIVIACKANDTARLYCNGAFISSVAVGSINQYPYTVAYGGVSDLNFRGGSSFAFLSHRAIEAKEAIDLTLNPWRIFDQRSRHVFVGASGGGTDVTTSGSIGGISLSATTGSATGSATTSGSIGSISLSAATGSATASVSATADIKAVSLSASTGSATGSATATGAVNQVSLTAVTGTASTAGDVAANGVVASLSLSAATGAATGTAVASGSVSSLYLGAATGTATVSISAAGALPVISLTAATGAASTGGDVVASAGIPALSLSAPTGASTGTATTSAALATISLSAATGTASAGADVSASGSIAVIGLTAPLGTATISIEAQAAIAAVFMSVPTGVATGSAACSGAMSAISLSACRATASNGLEDLPYLSQMVFARTFEQREFARIIDGRYFVRRS